MQRRGAVLNRIAAHQPEATTQAFADSANLVIRRHHLATMPADRSASLRERSL
jgi:hypothetical protein